MMKKVKQKTTQQLHDEIMQLFVGQKMSITLETLIETMVGVSNFMEVDSYDVIDMVVAELNIYREIENETKKSI
jgi:hypothetical protein